jgi:hypothetical protein
MCDFIYYTLENQQNLYWIIRFRLLANPED